MKTIRASEISDFVYCKRAWWYKQQGYPSENQGALHAGRRYHQQHGDRLSAAAWMQRLGILLVMLSLGLLVIWMIS